MEKLRPIFCSLLVLGLLVLSTAIVSRSAFGARPKWVGTYRGKRGYSLGSVIELEDRGYLIGGGSGLIGDKERRMWIMETTESGELLWKKLYRTEFQYRIRFMSSGENEGSLFAGQLSTPGDFNRVNALIARVGEKGETEWGLQFGKSLEDYDPSRPKIPFICDFYSLTRAHDGGYLAAGFYMPEKELEYGKTENKFEPSAYGILVKISDEGKVEWQKKYGAEGIHSFLSVERSKDGNYFAVGEVGSYGEKSRPETWVVKLTPDGEVIWQKTFSEKNKANPPLSSEIGRKEAGTSFDVTSDGGLVVTGINQIAAEGEFNAEIWIMKLNERGEIDWHRTYGGRGDDSPTNILETPDGGYIFAGTTDSFGGPSKVFRIWLMKLEKDGTIRWEKTYGEPGTSTYGSIKVLTGGDLIVHGEMERQTKSNPVGFMMILNKKGELKNLEDTVLQASPTDARTGIFAVSSTREKIPYEESNIPVSGAKIEVQGDDVGLDFLVEPPGHSD